ncbi:helix-turn-helix transcriptional regulator [Nocardiopsis coralliicola]
MRADRLLSFLLLLQNRGRMTAAELATALECSERTVYRDAEALGAAGVPLYAERGTGGGYRLVDGYRTRLTGFTGAEADSLFLSGLPGPAGALGLGSEMALAQLKLLAALPEEMAERADRVRSRFHLDATAWWRSPRGTPHLAALADAVWRERTVALAYRRFDGTEVQRTADPLGVVLKGDSWYLLARPAGAADDDLEAVRTYRVDRIRGAEPTGASFIRPAKFDLAEAWDARSRDFEESRYRLRVRVLLTDRGRALLPALSSERTATGAEELGTAPDGRTEVALLMESVPVAVHELSSYGADAEVLAPAELRTALAGHLRAAADRYPADLRPAPRNGA